MYKDFVSFVQDVVLPRQALNPDHLRLDGATTGGNREVAGKFHYNGIDWVVHSDSHYEPLLLAFASAKAGTEPFIEENTKKGRCLSLKPEIRAQQKSKYKYLYIYSWSKSNK